MVTGDFYPDQTGGQGIYAYEITRRIAESGWRVSVITVGRERRLSFPYPRNLKLLTLPPNTKDNPLSFNIAAALRRPSVSSPGSVLHINELFGFPFSLRRPPGTRALVISSHNSYLERFRAAKGFVKKLKYPPLMLLERLTYPKADRLIIGSEIERQPAIALGVRPERIRLIPYGVDIERFRDPSGARRKKIRDGLHIPQDAPVVIFVGRFVERKKPHIVAQALMHLRTSVPNLHALFIGDGEMMADVRSVVGDTSSFRLLGAVPFEQLPEYYLASDVFTLPSVGEGSISLAVIEAAAAGLPLVLTEDSAGGSSIFESGSNGVTVQVNDVVDLANALLSCLRRRQSYGARSRTIVNKRFSWDACAKSTIACYEESLAFAEAR